MERPVATKGRDKRRKDESRAIRDSWQREADKHLQGSEWRCLKELGNSSTGTMNIMLIEILLWEFRLSHLVRVCMRHSFHILDALPLSQKRYY